MVSDKIKALLSLKGIKQSDLAAYLGITPQSMHNKFSRGSFSVEDLIKICAFAGCTLSLDVDGQQKIILTSDDIRSDN